MTWSRFADLRRGEACEHHYIAGADFLREAREPARSEDDRRVSNGEQPPMSRLWQCIAAHLWISSATGNGIGWPNENGRPRGRP
jgi:hypothetical protein